VTVEPRRTAVHARARLASAIAALLVLSLPLAGCTGDDDASPPATTPTTTAAASAPRGPSTLAGAAGLVRRELAGVPQAGLLLGSSRAPVTVLEYADPTCAPCAAAQRGLIRALVARYVRPGIASVELRPLATSARARGLARSALAAGRQGRGWDVVQLAALRSTAAGTPSEPDARLAAALRLDLPRWRRDRALPRWRTELVANANVAAVARFQRLPVFLVRGRDAANEAFTIVTRPRSVDDLARAIDAARG
jgi:hypothetical protein